MANAVSCEGELLLSRPQGIWRAKQWSDGASKCSFSLLYKQNRYRLIARDRLTQKPGMFFPLDQVKEYAILEANRHQISLQDGRCFTILLELTQTAQVFKYEIRKALKVSGKSRQSLVEKADSCGSLLMGPPISDSELRREAFRRSRSKELQSIDEEDAVDIRFRPLPPIPRIDDIQDSAHDDVYEDIDDVTCRDEETLLQDAIMLGDEQEAAKWAMALAKQRRMLFISTGVNLDDIVNYLPKGAVHVSETQNIESIPGYLSMKQIKEITKDVLPPPVPPRSRSVSPIPRKKSKTPDANAYLTEVPPLKTNPRNHNALQEIWI